MSIDEQRGRDGDRLGDARAGPAAKGAGGIRRAVLGLAGGFGRAVKIPGSTRPLEALAGLLAGPGCDVEVVLLGFRLLLDLDDRLQRRLFVAGDYEAAERAYLLSHLPPGGTFIDVGANVGWHTLAAARALQGRGLVVAFEPSPANQERLERNLILNGFRNVRVEPCALSDREETLVFSSPFPRSGNATAARRERPARTFEAWAVPLDHLLVERGIGRVDVVKIDVEGAETKVLRGMRGLLSRSDAPCVLCEVNPEMLRQMGSSREELMDLMRGFGFGPVSIARGRGQRGGPPAPGGDLHENLAFERG